MRIEVLTDKDALNKASELENNITDFVVDDISYILVASKPLGEVDEWQLETLAEKLNICYYKRYETSREVVYVVYHA